MRTKVHKWFWVWDFEKEEKWLNEMASKGLALTSVGYCTYFFEDSQPGKYTIKLEMLEFFPSHVQSRKYIEFLEETGAEYIGSMMRWVYFRKPKELGEFELYSDYQARIKHLSLIFNLLVILAVLNLFNAFNNLVLSKLQGIAFNFYVGLFVLVIGLLLSLGAYKIYKNRKLLKKEAQLFE